MSAQDKFAPYLNRFTTLLQQNATAVLEFKCKDGKVTVNLCHELGGVEKAPPTINLQNPSHRNTQKKAVKPSQLRRLHKRAATRAEKSSVAAAEQAKDYNSTQNKESEKDSTEKVKGTTEPPEKDMALKGKAEEAKVELKKLDTEPDNSDGQPKLKEDKLVLNTSKKFKCRVCDSNFKNKDELKEHWTFYEIFCKTCKKCCIAASIEGTEDVYPGDLECESHDWSIIKNKCDECIFICKSKQTLQNHMIKKHGK